MAKKLNETTAAGIGHNELSETEINAVLAAACQDLHLLDEERSTFNAKQKQAREKIKQGKIKGLVGMKIADFNALIYRPFMLRRDDENMEDFKQYRTAQQIAHNFLAVGEQANFLDVLQEMAEAGRSEDIGAKAGAAKSGGKKGAKGSKKAASNGSKAGDGFEEDQPESTADAKAKGFEAGKAGENFDSNPYDEGSKNHQHWAKGWRAGQAEIGAGIGKGGGIDTHAP
jgi:ribosome modulation factor